MAYTTEYLQYLQNGLDHYEEAFSEWMKTQEETDPLLAPGLTPTVFNKSGIPKDHINETEVKLGEASAQAATAVRITGAYIQIKGMGLIDPLSNWGIMSMPKAVLSPQEIRRCISTVRGRLQQMIDLNEMGVDGSGDAIPTFSPASMHKLIWQAAAPHWTTHQYRVALSEAANALTNHWREKLERMDVDGTKFWQQSLSEHPADKGQPRLRWSKEHNNSMVSKDMNKGIPSLVKALMFFAEGLTNTVRNPCVHSRNELTEQDAMERLGAYSFLARLLDQCEIERVEDDSKHI